DQERRQRGAAGGPDLLAEERRRAGGAAGVGRRRPDRPQEGRRHAVVLLHCARSARARLRHRARHREEEAPMNEVKVYGSLLGVLLVGSYLSWNRDDSAKPSEDKAII